MTNNIQTPDEAARTVQVRLPQWLLFALKEVAAKKAKTVSAVIRDLVIQEVGERPEPTQAPAIDAVAMPKDICLECRKGLHQCCYHGRRDRLGEIILCECECLKPIRRQEAE